MRVRSILLLLFALTSSLFAQSNPVPFVSQPLVPNAAEPGGRDFVLTINGAGFVPGAVVTWNGSPRPTTFLTSTRIAASIPASDIAQASTASVMVINPLPGGGGSSPLPFTITEPRVFPLYFSATSVMKIDHRGKSVAAVDLNNDGRPDIAWASARGSLWTFNNAGDGTFTGAVNWQGRKGKVTPIVIGDFNRDLGQDLAVIIGGELWVIMGGGRVSGPPFFLSHVAALAAGDFNADGALDLAVGAHTDWGFQPLLLGNGDGTFQFAQWWQGDLRPMAMATGDFDGDGNLDLAVVPDQTGSQVCAMLGNSDGTFRAGACSETGNAQSVTAADVNSDGVTDLVVANRDSHAVSVLLGNGDGTFQSRYDYYGPGEFEPTSVAVGDLDGDGRQDLAVSDRKTGQVFLWFGNGDGTFFPNPGPMPKVGMTDSIAIADFNGDGRPDLVVAGGYKITVLSQAPLLDMPRNVHFLNTGVGDGQDLDLDLANLGSADVRVTNIAIVAGDKHSFIVNSTCALEPPGAFCPVYLLFIPQWVGKQWALMRVDYQAPGMRPRFFYVTLVGRGTPRSHCCS